MKFMKLGSKPDVFLGDGNSIRYACSELATDVAISVGEVTFYLHKFPLLSKSNCLQKLILEASEEGSSEVDLENFPGGPKAFEICAKFCYGVAVTLNAYNVVAARCAAEFLEMTEDVEQGNLIFKIEVFLNSSIFRTWKDSIIVLQTTKSLLPWSEDLKVVARCIDSIASKASVEPSKVAWSYTNNRRLSMPDKIVEHDIIESIPRDWWVEDICELDMDMYNRVMVSIKSKGRMDAAVIGEALRTYVVRWLPDSVDVLVSVDHIERNKSLVKTIICLLPVDQGVGCSCSFLLKLLKAATLVEIDNAAREVLALAISMNLFEASVGDLLIPARSPQTTIYDVKLVQSMVKRFFMRVNCKTDVGFTETEKGNGDFLLRREAWLNVARLVDAYLAEVAPDRGLPVFCFVDLARLVPESSRPIHDGLYRAIDIYLKEHPNLPKAEKKKICGLMDVKKLTMEASMHAAQNDRLPLRVVVQVLFFEQVRAAAAAQTAGRTTPNNVSNSIPSEEDDWDKRTLGSCKSSRKQVDEMKLKDEDFQSNGKLVKKNSKSTRSGIQLLPSRSRRIFDRLWVMGKGHGESKSSETSGSSQSPTSLAPCDAKSSGSSSRHRRHSIS